MKKQILAAAVALGLAAGAQAQDWEVSGYVQGNLGWAKASKPKAMKEVNSLGWDKTSSDRSDVGYKLLVGLQLNPYVALETQYVDFGKSTYKYKWNYGSIGRLEQEKYTFATKGLGVNLVGTYPVTDEFTLFAKTGMHKLRTKVKGKYIDVGPEWNDYDKASKTVSKWAQSFGIGGGYEFVENFEVIAEYERYQGVANKKIEGVKVKHSIDYLSAGIRYKF